MSLSAVQMPALDIDRLPVIPFFGDGNGHPIPLFSGGFHNLAYDAEYVIGLKMNNKVYPLLDARGRQVLLSRNTDELVYLTPELHYRYGHLFIQQKQNPFSPPVRKRARHF